MTPSLEEDLVAINEYIANKGGDRPIFVARLKRILAALAEALRAPATPAPTLADLALERCAAALEQLVTQGARVIILDAPPPLPGAPPTTGENV